MEYSLARLCRSAREPRDKKVLWIKTVSGNSDIQLFIHGIEGWRDITSVLTEEEKALIRMLTQDGDGDKFLSDDGTYKPIFVDVVVIDNLVSTSTTSSLSANQGRVLKSLIDAHHVSVNNDLAALSNDVVKLTGNQTVSGVKTFNSSPIVPTPTTNNQIANKIYVDNIASNLNSIFNNHINNTNNPHSVTKAQVGLSNVNNTSDLNKPISLATQTALDLKVNITELSLYQRKLTAGANITIDANNVIASTGGGGVAIDIIDNLSSTRVDAALSANQGRLIDLVSVKTNTNQTISGIKTFTALPITSITPANNNQLTNKQYVDDTINTQLNPINTQITNLTNNKQDKLVAGANITISGNTISATSGGGGGDVGVIDNLNSTSTTDALSANQGRVLNSLLNTLSTNITNLTTRVTNIEGVNTAQQTSINNLQTLVTQIQSNITNIQSTLSDYDADFTEIWTALNSIAATLDEMSDQFIRVTE